MINPITIPIKIIENKTVAIVNIPVTPMPCSFSAPLGDACATPFPISVDIEESNSVVVDAETISGVVDGDTISVVVDDKILSVEVDVIASAFVGDSRSGVVDVDFNISDVTDETNSVDVVVRISVVVDEIFSDVVDNISVVVDEIVSVVLGEIAFIFCITTILGANGADFA